MARNTVHDLGDLVAEVQALTAHLDARGLNEGERIAVLSVALSSDIQAAPMAEADRKRLLLDAALLMRLRLSGVQPKRDIDTHAAHQTAQ